MSRVLISGGAGFIGVHLARKLVAEGHRVDLLDNFARGARDSELKALEAQPAVALIARDLLRPTALSDLDRDYDLIFHLAAIVGVEAVVGAPYDVLSRNMEMLTRLLGFAGEQKALHRFIFASTSEVYAGSLGLPDFALPTPESVPIVLPGLDQPRTSYLLSKLYGEALCLHAGLPVTIVRPHNIYGPRMGWSHVIPQLLERMRQSEAGARLSVFSPTHTRAFCHVSDAVEMMIRLALGEVARDGTFNIGNQSAEITMWSLAEQILSLTGRTLELEAGPDTPGSPARRCPDMTKTLAATRFEPKVSLADGLAETATWYQTNQRPLVGVAAE